MHTVCLAPQGALGYPNGGGYLWIYLNWALGLQALGCRVVWLEGVDVATPVDKLRASIATFKERLEPYGLAESIALCSWSGKPLPPDVTDGYMDLDAAAEADLLLNQRYGAPSDIVDRFRRSALLDIDPGLLQAWMDKGWVNVARHDFYFTIGETVGWPGTRFPDLGLHWQYTPPCVALDWWSPHPPVNDAAFTTLAHWYAAGGAADTDEVYADDKRSGFLPYLGLPQRTDCPLELALDVGGNDYDRAMLEERGWRVRDAYAVAGTPQAYQDYVRGSLGEFSCAKPSYVRLETAWISDRTVCYLASGKPAVVQHTGPSQILPDAGGLFRFQNFEGATRSLKAVMADYEEQGRLARSLAEEHFDATKVVRKVLEHALA